MKEEAFLQEIESLPLFTAIHLIESQLLKADSQLGTDSLPKHEKIQLTVSQRLGYEANELTNVTPNGPNKKFVLQTNLIGLTGEQGVLPNHYSEWVIQRVRDNDTAMRDFFDIFNHRLLSLYYRCWQSYQLSAQLRLMSSTQSSPIQTVLSSLTGHLGDEAIFWGEYSHQNAEVELSSKTPSSSTQDAMRVCMSLKVAGLISVQKSKLGCVA